MASQDIDEVPSPFRALWDYAERLIRPPRDEFGGRLHVLPPSLMRAAELVEESAVYRTFLDARLWGNKLSAWRIREALRRAGFYQAVQAASDSEPIWRLLDARVRPHTVRVRTLALLDGCRFPLEQFRVGGVSVERLSRDMLEGLGPRSDVARVFFSNEILDPRWYTRVWFLVKEEERQVRPGSIVFRLGYDVLNEFLEPITALTLYKIDYFGLPIVVESSAGWHLERVQWSEPMIDLVDDGSGEADEVPRSDYDVGADEQRRFAAFLAFFDDAIKTARAWRVFRLAARRYLRAIRIAGPHPSSADDHGDALLQYVFALELLLSMGEREAIGDKLATRAAWLVGTNDRVRNETFRAVKNLWGARSSAVHGAASQHKDSQLRQLDGVRDLLRRTLVGLMAVRRATGSENECVRVVQTAAFDRSSQSQIASATAPVWCLLDPGPEWGRGGWGPRFERTSDVR